jgi:hypothetical protein
MVVDSDFIIHVLIYNAPIYCYCAQYAVIKRKKRKIYHSRSDVKQPTINQSINQSINKLVFNLLGDNKDILVAFT